MSNTRTNNKFKDLIPDGLALANKYQQLKRMGDPSVINLVHEEQNGTCIDPNCTQGIKIIARVHSMMTNQVKYFGFCEKHAEPYRKLNLLHKKI